MRKLFNILVILVVLAGIAAGVATWAIKKYLTPEKVKTLIEEQVTSQLHRKVSLGSISVGLLQGLQVTEFKLSELPDFNSGTFISSDKFVLHIRLIPLLFKKIMIKDIELVKPKVSIVRNPDGKTFNFSSLSSTTTANGSESSSPLGLFVSRASIKNGTINFRDESPAKQSLEVEKLELTLKNFSLSSPMTLNTSFSVKTKGTELGFDFKGNVNLDGDIKIQSCDLISGPSKLKIAGEAKNMISDHATYDLKVLAQNYQPGLLMSLGLFPKDIKLDGSIDGNVAAQGTTENLSLTADLDLGKTGLVYGEQFRKKPGVPMSIKLESTAKNKKDLDISQLQLKLASLELSGDGSIQNMTDENPGIKLRVLTNEFAPSDVIPHFPAAKLPPELNLSGNMQLNSEINGTKQAGNISLKIDGKPLAIKYGDSFNKKSGMPLAIEASAKYSGSLTMDISALTLTLGRMVLSGPGKYVSDPKSSRYFFTLKSPSVPLDDLAAAIPMLGEYALAGSGELNLKILSSPSGADASGTFNFSNTSAKYGETKLSQLAGASTFSPDAFSLPKLTGLLNGSSLNATINGKKLKTHPTISSDIDVAVLDLDKLIPKEEPPEPAQKKSDAGGLFVHDAWAAQPAPELPMDLIGSLKAGQVKHEHFYGKNLSAKWNLNNYTSDMRRLEGSAYLNQGPGEIKNIQKLTTGSVFARILLMPITLFQKAGKLLGAGKVPSFDNFKFKDIIGNYSFHAGKMTISKFDMNGDLSASMIGTVELAGDQALNLKAQIKPKSDSQQLSLINLQIKGTVADPKVGLDLAATGSQAIKAIQNGTADNLLHSLGLPGLGKKSKSPSENQPAQQPDQAQPGSTPAQQNQSESQPQPETTEEKAIKGLLKGLFKK